MLDVCLLGTGGMMPLPNRWLTSALIRYSGISILIDCGEGTQIAMKQSGWSPKPIDVMCFTHFHADHISGLPGMLLTMGNANKTTPLTIIGPKGVGRVVNSLRVIAPELPFDIEYIELDKDNCTIELNGYAIHAFRVNHNVICYGYSITVSRAGIFMLDKALSLNIDKRLWGRLQKGESVECDGRRILPNMVMGSPRKGIKFTYTTDTRPTNSIIEAAYKSDLFICEGIYGDNDMLDKAREHKHMTFCEAADIARKADVAELWLTHYSPSLVRPQLHLKEVRKVFRATKTGRDGMKKTLRFED